MDEPASVPLDDLTRVASAEARLASSLVTLTDEEVRRPSLLPGWTVGHVLTHVARNADSHRRRADAAARGEVVDQYAGGVAGRAAAIEDGARRPAAALVDDVARSRGAMQAAWRRVPVDRWGAVSRDVGGRARPLHTLPARRWQEVEVHQVDLGLGVTPRDWPDEFVAVWLPRLRAGLAARLPDGASAPPAGSLDERDELAWLYGRLSRDDLPPLAPWA